MSLPHNYAAVHIKEDIFLCHLQLIILSLNRGTREKIMGGIFRLLFFVVWHMFILMTCETIVSLIYKISIPFILYCATCWTIFLVVKSWMKLLRWKETFIIVHLNPSHWKASEHKFFSVLLCNFSCRQYLLPF